MVAQQIAATKRKATTLWAFLVLLIDVKAN
jgi:hypothetical protein